MAGIVIKTSLVCLGLDCSDDEDFDMLNVADIFYR